VTNILCLALIYQYVISSNVSTAQIYISQLLISYFSRKVDVGACQEMVHGLLSHVSPSVVTATVCTLSL
jgi:hypothetical protein